MPAALHEAIWDNVRGLDVLASLRYPTQGFGCIGHSLGGHNGVCSPQPSIRVSRIVITSCGLDSFRDYYDGNPAVWQAGKGWCQDRYMPGWLAPTRGALGSPV